MAPKRSKLGDIDRQRQAEQSNAPSTRDTTEDFVMIPSSPASGETAATQIPAAGIAEATEMEIEPFVADFGDDKMEIDNDDDGIETLESFGLTKLEMREQAKQTGAQI